MRREDVQETPLTAPDRDAFVAWIEKLSVDAIATDEQKFLDRSIPPTPSACGNCRAVADRAYVIEEQVTAG